MAYLVENRQKDGQFKNLSDFIERQRDNEYLNRKSMESLIKAGALDCLMDRGRLMANLDSIMSALHWSMKHVSEKQVNLLDLAPESDFNLSNFGFQSQAVLEIASTEKLDWERELLGIYISQHPLDLYQNALAALKPTSLADLNESTETVADNEKRRVSGLLAKMKAVTAKISKRKMAIIELEDKSASLELALSPAIFEKYYNCWAEGNVLALTLQAYSVDFQGNSLPHTSWSITAAHKLEPDTK